MSPFDHNSAREIFGAYEEARKRILAAGLPEKGAIVIKPRHDRAIMTLAPVPPAKIGGAELLRVVASAHRISMDELVGRHRIQTYVFARHHAVTLLLFHRPELSYLQVGALLNRDHTTIIHSRRKWPNVAHNCKRQAAEIFERTGLMTPMELYAREVPFQ
jgi:chromosomal replication initiation ATPase DnaA